MSDTIPPPPPESTDGDEPEQIELKHIYRLILQVRKELVEIVMVDRDHWGEAEATLLAQGALHRERLDEHETEIDELKAGLEHEANERDARDAEVRTKIHDLRNKVTPLFADVDELKKRMLALEDSVKAPGRRDTEIRPPPPSEPPAPANG